MLRYDVRLTPKPRDLIEESRYDPCQAKSRPPRNARKHGLEKLVLTIAEVSGSIWVLDNVGP